MAGLIYLASPYSNPRAAIRLERYFATLRFTSTKLLEGYAIFSPIVYGEQMAGEIGTTFEAWANLNDRMIAACDAFWVLMLPGWQESRGIAHELKVWQNLQPFRKPHFFNTDGVESLNENYRHD